MGNFNLRELAPMLQSGAGLKTCGALGCGCVGFILTGLLLLGLPLILGAAWLFWPTTATAPRVVTPVMLGSNNAVGMANQSGAGMASSNAVGQATQGATVTDRALLPYMPYQPQDQTWANSNANRAGYLAWANLTGARRTPYSRGQVLRYSNGATYTVVSADFDFVLLQDGQGREWSCPADVNTLDALNHCQEWQRGKF